MDRGQHGHSSVRTNNEIRSLVRLSINNFFNQAKEKIKEPDYYQESLPLLEKYKIDKEIHPHFYEDIWRRVMFSTDHNVNLWNVNLPPNKYGALNAKEYNDDTISGGGYYTRLYVKTNSIPPAIQKYHERVRELATAREALLEAASEALRETTIEKALIRFPELKRFLPNAIINQLT